MIRGITVIALGGLAVCVTAFAAAGALGHIGWHVPGLGTMVDESAPEGRTLRLTGNEPVVTRSLAWPGGSAITISVPGRVTYTQGPTSGITLTGPEPLANHVVLHDHTLELDGTIRTLSYDKGLTIVVTAPAVQEFTLESAQILTLDKLDVDRLKITLEGAGRVTAGAGRVGTLDLSIEGAGDADLSALALTDAKIEIDGFGNVSAGPTGAAKVEINGAGNVTLTRRPASLEQEINGGGHISQPDAPAGVKL